MTSALLHAALSAPAQILFSGSGYSPATNNVIERGSATAVTLTISGVADAAARQSAKADLGATWATRYAVKAAIEFHTAPTAGEVVQFFWSNSDSATAAVGNEGNATGSDAAYAGYDANLADSIRNLVYIGALPVVNDIVVHIMTVGYLDATNRHGSLIIVNESGQTLAGTDGIESAVALTPIIMQGQDT